MHSGDLKKEQTKWYGLFKKKNGMEDTNNKTIWPLYKLYVCCHCGYCVHLWSPHLLGVAELEKVQGRATMMKGMKTLPYAKR